MNGISGKRKIRVACLYGSMAKGGGAEQSVLGLVRGLDPERFEAYLILRRRVEDEHDLTGVNILPPRCRSKSETWWKEWRFAGEMFQVVRKHKIDIVHSHSGTSPVDRLGLLAAGLAGAKIIRTMRHTPTPVRSRFGLLRCIFDHYTVCWTVVSPDIIPHLSAATGVPASQIESTPNGIDLSSFSNQKTDRDEQREKLGVQEEEILLLAVGRLAATKDHATLIRMMHEMGNRGGSVRLCIAGGGDASALERVIDELGIRDRVQLLGYRNDVSDLLVAADFFVSASLNEGLPRAMVEAMASIVPVVATDIPGTHFLLDGGTAGVLVPVKSPNVMAQAILSLIENEDKWCMYMRAGYKRALNEFSADAMVSRYDELYCRLCLGLSE